MKSRTQNLGHKTQKGYRFLLFCVLCLVFLPAAADAATIGKPVSNLGLVGYWPFDEGSGTRAHDLSGNGKNGTLGNSPEWISGKRAGALHFSGADTHVWITDDPLYDFGTSQDFTISAWIRHSGSGNYEVIVDKKAGSVGGYPGYMFRKTNSGDRLGLLFVDDLENSGGIVGNQDIADGTWKHVAVTVDRDGLSTLYVNGVLDATADASAVVGNTDNTRQVRIGQDNFGNNDWTGGIDDVRIYRRALSASEIAALYRSGQSSHVGATKTGLVGHWSFNEGSGTIAHDLSGRGNSGTLANNATWTTGRKGKAATFDGNDDYINAGTDSSLNITGMKTIAAWVRTTDTTASARRIVSKRESLGAGVTTGYEVTLNTSTCQLAFAHIAVNPTVTYTMSNCSDGAWRHVVAVYDGTQGHIYVNGQLRASATFGAASSNSQPFLIGTCGSEYNNGASGCDFNGQIDDVRIYNRALSAAEVAALYSSTETTINRSQNSELTDGLVGFWTFNGPDLTTTTATDVSGQGNNGTLTNSPAPTVGRVGQGMLFNGSNYLEMGDVLDMGLGDMTISVWAKTTSTGINRYLASKSKAAMQNFRYAVGVSAAGTARIFMQGDGGADIELNGNVNIADGKWHLLTFIFDRDEEASLYVDGVFDASQSISHWSGANMNSDNPFRIGVYTAADNMGVINGLPGTLDEFRVYNRTLSVSEVKRLYNMGR